MYYFGLLAAALAAVAGAVQFDIPPSGYRPVQGEPLEIAYSGADGPVTITLKNGPIGDLQTVEVIGNGPAGEGSITWVPGDLPSDMYAFEIMVTDGSAVNYSPQFPFQGSGPATTNIDTATSTEIDTTIGTDATTTPTPAAVTTPTNTTLNTTTTETDTTMTDATATTTEDAATTTTEPINQNENNGNSRLGSSMALVLCAAALLATFN